MASHKEYERRKKEYRDRIDDLEEEIKNLKPKNDEDSKKLNSIKRELYSIDQQQQMEDNNGISSGMLTGCGFFIIGFLLLGLIAGTPIAFHQLLQTEVIADIEWTIILCTFLYLGFRHGLKIYVVATVFAFSISMANLMPSIEWIKPIMKLESDYSGEGLLDGSLFSAIFIFTPWIIYTFLQIRKINHGTPLKNFLGHKVYQNQWKGMFINQIEVFFAVFIITYFVYFLNFPLNPDYKGQFYPHAALTWIPEAFQSSEWIPYNDVFQGIFDGGTTTKLF